MGIWYLGDELDTSMQDVLHLLDQPKIFLSESGTLKHEGADRVSLQCVVLEVE